MPQLKISWSGTVDSMRASLNGKPIRFGADGKAAIDVVGGEHPLMWVVMGDEGAKYLIEVTAPPQSLFKHNATLDAGKKDAGIQWVKA